MRIRCKPWAKPELEACPFYVKDPAAFRGNWQAAFPDGKKPLRIELGCGKGGFISQEAPANPGYHYLAMDIKNEMLVLAKRKLEEAYGGPGSNPDSVRIFICNIMQFDQIFSPRDRVDRIYINFCNPWPKSKHKKRRLTHPRQLMQYRSVLDGEIWFKTDDEQLFSESLTYFRECGFEILFQTTDLHRESGICSYPTEHERMFEEQGKTIRFLRACPISGWTAPKPEQEPAEEKGV